MRWQQYLPDMMLDPYYSDEAVSRYLEESGGCLTELMLNNIEKVFSPFCLVECYNPWLVQILFLGYHNSIFAWDADPLVFSFFFGARDHMKWFNTTYSRKKLFMDWFRGGVLIEA